MRNMTRLFATTSIILYGIGSPIKSNQAGERNQRHANSE